MIIWYYSFLKSSLCGSSWSKDMMRQVLWPQAPPKNPSLILVLLEHNSKLLSDESRNQWRKVSDGNKRDVNKQRGGRWDNPLISDCCRCKLGPNQRPLAEAPELQTLHLWRDSSPADSRYWIINCPCQMSAQCVGSNHSNKSQPYFVIALAWCGQRHWDMVCLLPASTGNTVKDSLRRLKDAAYKRRRRWKKSLTGDFFLAGSVAKVDGLAGNEIQTWMRLCGDAAVKVSEKSKSRLAPKN